MVIILSRWSWIHCHVNKYRDRNNIVSNFCFVVHGRVMWRIWNKRWWWRGVHHRRLRRMCCPLGVGIIMGIVIMLVMVVIVGCFMLTILTLLTCQQHNYKVNRHIIIIFFKNNNYFHRTILNLNQDQNQNQNHQI